MPNSYLCRGMYARLLLISVMLLAVVSDIAAQGRRVRGASRVEWEHHAGGDSTMHITSLPVYVFNRKADLRRYL